MNHPEELPSLEFIEQPITQAEIVGQSGALNAIDDIEQKKAEYNKLIQNPELIRELGSILVGGSDPSRQE